MRSAFARARAAGAANVIAAPRAHPLLASGKMTRQILSAMFVACVLAIAAVHAGAASRVVDIRVGDRFLLAPATLRILVVVEPHAANRTLQIEVDGDGMFSASEMPLEGDGEKRLHQFSFRGVPAGRYTIQAAVRSTSGVRGTATASVDVIAADR